MSRSYAAGTPHTECCSAIKVGRMHSLLTHLRGGGPNKREISSLSSNPCWEHCSGCCYFYSMCSNEMKSSVWVANDSWKLKSRLSRVLLGISRLWFCWMWFYCLLIALSLYFLSVVKSVKRLPVNKIIHIIKSFRTGSIVRQLSRFWCQSIKLTRQAIETIIYFYSSYPKTCQVVGTKVAKFKISCVEAPKNTSSTTMEIV